MILLLGWICRIMIKGIIEDDIPRVFLTIIKFCKMFELSSKQYMYIYAYCFITKGKDRFSIYNSRSGKIHLFDIELFDVAKSQFRKLRIVDILKLYNEDDQLVIKEFIVFLINNELGRLVEDISLFPELNIQYYSCPYYISHSIIDIRFHDFDLLNIFKQLDELLCKEVEVRCFREIDLNKLREITTMFSKYSMSALYVLMPYMSIGLNQDNVKEVAAIIKTEPRLQVVIYNVPESITVDIMNDPYLESNLCLFHKSIDGCIDCGAINTDSLPYKTIYDVLSNHFFNGCLNNMICIDENGYIKNCPAMKKTYGHVNTTKLKEVYENTDFKKLWIINNDRIDKCKECEFRYICDNCRAFLTDPENIYSSPQKCDYCKQIC